MNKQELKHRIKELEKQLIARECDLEKAENDAQRWFNEFMKHHVVLGKIVAKFDELGEDAEFNAAKLAAQKRVVLGVDNDV